MSRENKYRIEPINTAKDGLNKEDIETLDLMNKVLDLDKESTKILLSRLIEKIKSKR